MNKQFIVTESDKNKRKEFYDYIVNKYHLDIWYPYDRDSFSKNKYPFVIDFKNNKLWICESITCLACAKIITIADFKRLKI